VNGSYRPPVLTIPDFFPAHRSPVQAPAVVQHNYTVEIFFTDGKPPYAYLAGTDELDDIMSIVGQKEGQLRLPENDGKGLLILAANRIAEMHITLEEE
jgi:hypothetical protein